MSNIIGLNYGSHDNGVSLVIDGKLVCAIEEEKMTGVKACYTPFNKPDKALAHIEKNYGVTLENCDSIAAPNPYYREFIKNNYHIAHKFFSYSRISLTPPNLIKKDFLIIFTITIQCIHFCN